jgi:anaerobic ribonucleoside-triphosphate reductase activating protein
MDTWTPAGGETQVDAVLAQLRGWVPDADGFTISGGEPFDQPEALLDMTAPQTLTLRGSDNQRLHCLTPLGRQRFSALPRPAKALDVMFDDDGSVWFAGIPSRGDFQRLRELLADQGHHVQTSAAKAPDRKDRNQQS